MTRIIERLRELQKAAKPASRAGMRSSGDSGSATDAQHHADSASESPAPEPDPIEIPPLPAGDPSADLLEQLGGDPAPKDA